MRITGILVVWLAIVKVLSYVNGGHSPALTDLLPASSTRSHRNVLIDLVILTALVGTCYVIWQLYSWRKNLQVQPARPLSAQQRTIKGVINIFLPTCTLVLYWWLSSSITVRSRFADLLFQLGVWPSHHVQVRQLVSVFILLIGVLLTLWIVWYVPPWRRGRTAPQRRNLEEEALREFLRGPRERGGPFHGGGAGRGGR